MTHGRLSKRWKKVGRVRGLKNQGGDEMGWWLFYGQGFLLGDQDRVVWFDLYMAVFKQPTSVPIASHGWSFASAVLGQITYLVASLAPNSVRSCVMQGASCTQRRVSMVPFVFSIPFVLSWGGSISLDSFLPSILLLVVIVVTIVIVAVILIFVIVAIVAVVIVVTVIGVVIIVMIFSLVFLLVWLVFAIVAACASKAAATLSTISCQIAARVMAGVLDVDVLLGAILST
nr:hypothetical protein [Tanacetum cinerariifolium]